MHASPLDRDSGRNGRIGTYEAEEHIFTPLHVKTRLVRSFVFRLVMCCVDVICWKLCFFFPSLFCTTRGVSAYYTAFLFFGNGFEAARDGCENNKNRDADMVTSSLKCTKTFPPCFSRLWSLAVGG